MESAFSSPAVRHTYQHSGIYPKDEVNRMASMLAAISGENGVRVSVDPSGIKFYGNTETDQASFHFELFYLGVNSVGVRAGRYNRYAVDDQQTVELSVFPGWKDGAASIASDIDKFFGE